MAKKTDANNIQTRLEDAKKQYNFNESVIEMLMKDIKVNDLIIQNGNNTYSASPQLRTYQELAKANITLRKQINEMEEILQNGTIKTEEEANPFE